ncbi:hypothetical protein JXB31_01965 [Candidatus Woesearchaeota archaeon]|nr:hypothetical protein [Candidatus Woesearchaeota archaeon]
MGKKGQTLAVDSYVAVGIFLLAVILFFSIIALRSARLDMKNEVKIITGNVMAHAYFNDNTLEGYEETVLSNLTCDELKDLFETNNNLCIYFEDSDGNVVPISRNQKYGMGCPGLNISGTPCGSNIE